MKHTKQQLEELKELWRALNAAVRRQYGPQADVTGDVEPMCFVDGQLSACAVLTEPTYTVALTVKLSVKPKPKKGKDDA